MPASRRPRSPRRSSSPTRLATVYTWQPDTRVERTVRRRRLPFSGDAPDLIHRAAQLVTPLTPFQAWVSFFPHHHALNLNCGTDEHGVQTHVSVTLHPSDVGVLTYFARERSVAGTLFMDLADDGDGEELDVPRVSVDELARMPVPVGLMCDAPAKGGR